MYQKPDVPERDLDRVREIVCGGAASLDEVSERARFNINWTREVLRTLASIGNECATQLLNQQ